MELMQTNSPIPLGLPTGGIGSINIKNMGWYQIQNGVGYVKRLDNCEKMVAKTLNMKIGSQRESECSI